MNITANHDDCITPNHNDVLLGRGGRNNEHSGNVQLRLLALQNASEYNDCPRLDKHKIFEYLVEQVKGMNPPGRFLIQDQRTNLWHEVDDDKAHQKASQHLRDATKEIRRKQNKNDFTHHSNKFDCPKNQIRRLSMSCSEGSFKKRCLEFSHSEARMPVYQEAPFPDHVTPAPIFPSPVQEPTMNIHHDQITDDWDAFLTHLPLDNSLGTFSPLHIEEDDSLYGKEDETVDTVESAFSWESLNGTDYNDQCHPFTNIECLIHL